jgi:PAS domain S-box-containing protein
LTAPPIPPNEAQRVAALRAYDILDTAEEDIFNAITRAAADVCATPMAALTFIDTGRQWIKSRFGLTIRETSREMAFCAHAINGQQLFLIEDTHKDVRFREHPGVVGDPKLRFYAGMPLVASGGLSLGTLCVLDTVSRNLTPEQADKLRVLAESAMRVLNLRRSLGVTVFAKAVDLTSDGVTIAGATPEGTSILYANESFLHLTGYEYQEVLNQPCTFPVPRTCAEAQQAFEHASARGQMTTVECRFETKHGESLWDRVSFVPYVDDQCRLLYVVAVHRDITAQKEAEAQTQQLHAMRTTLATVDHVVKNFMNSAHFYALHVASGRKVEEPMQKAFEAALENARRQLAAIHRMPAFKDRATPFGLSLLDTDQEL